jgi:hypothetical protein
MRSIKTQQAHWFVRLYLSSLAALALLSGLLKATMSLL